MSTGLPNVMMSRKVKGKVEDVFLAKQKAGTKEGIKRVSAEMTTKTFDETGLKKKGNLLAVVKDSVNYTKKLLPFFKIGEGVVKNVLPKQLKLAINTQMAKK